ncbi:MAG: ribosome recycling factor [Symbiobacteriaceae bacterium]|nr:ribosome recycling factor [Symbiobacteriaceae bacterium]
MPDSDVIKTAEDRMQKTIQALRKDLSTIRAGRAMPSLLDRITVDYYGQATPIHQMAGVSCPDPRTILIQPWDKGTLKSIEKAIQASDLGINPSNDGVVIRLVIPALTGERRKELNKLVEKKGEEGKVALRNIRRDANEETKKEEKASLITEDDEKLALEEIQKMTEKHIKEVDSVIEAKKKEIMEV